MTELIENKKEDYKTHDNSNKNYLKRNNSLDIKKQIKENEKMIKLKKIMFTRQKYMRSQFSKYSEGKTKNDIINEFLEDMCIYSNIIKKEIEDNQDKYIKIEDALKMEDKDEGLFCLGLLANNLKKIGINAVIENNLKDDFDDIIFGYEDIIRRDKEEEAITVFQFIVSGFLNKKKYILHFDFGDEENEELLNNKKKYDNFIKILKKK